MANFSCTDENCINQGDGNSERKGIKEKAFL